MALAFKLQFGVLFGVTDCHVGLSGLLAMTWSLVVGCAKNGAECAEKTVIANQCAHWCGNP